MEFLVLHYTSVSLAKTLEIFQNPKAKASAHLVIDQSGEIYELVSCLNGLCHKAWHAGGTHFSPAGTTTILQGFNNFSIGIELVNYNGNFYPYTKEQYEALQALLKELKTYYPALKDPNRVLGHEHIASHRGKVDPGHGFDWPLFFKMNYPKVKAPVRKPLLPKN